MSYREELIQVAGVAVAALEDLYNDSTGDIEFTNVVLNDIKRERKRQEEKWGSQHHSKEKWFTILGEEVGEVANAILEDY